MLVISDTSPLNYLVLIEEIELLPRLYGQITLPGAVHQELQHPATPARVMAWAQNLPAWASVETPQYAPVVAGLGRGESEAIALALQHNAALVLIDERRGRNYAVEQGLAVTGTLGILEAAARRGLVNLPIAVSRLRTTSFRASPAAWKAFQERTAAL